MDKLNTLRLLAGMMKPSETIPHGINLKASNHELLTWAADEIERLRTQLQLSAETTEKCDRHNIRALALLSGFKTRPQEGRPDDLNDYVYGFAHVMIGIGQAIEHEKYRAAIATQDILAQLDGQANCTRIGFIIPKAHSMRKLLQDAAGTIRAQQKRIAGMEEAIITTKQMCREASAHLNTFLSRNK